MFTQLNRISSTTQFNGVNVLNGTFGDISLQIGYDPSQKVNMSVNSSDATTLGAFQDTSTVETLAGVDTYALATAALTTTIADAADYTISGFFGTDTAYIAAEAGARDVAAAFNLIAGNTGVTATAETRARLTVTAAETFSFDLSMSAFLPYRRTFSVLSTSSCTIEPANIGKDVILFNIYNFLLSSSASLFHPPQLP